MNYTVDNHPTEEVLGLCALDDQYKEIEEHLESCESCREYIDDIRSIKSEIESLGEEEIPPVLNQRILSIMKDKGTSKRIPPFIQEWYKRPFIYGILTVMAALLLYVLFEYFV
ncbi:MAG TPA: hypothetical protein VHO70_10495 [Chitinispirillaceae bacterium]|nr:hypothetical protein [Chitinispirillaceae bacterium]